MLRPKKKKLIESGASGFKGLLNYTAELYTLGKFLHFLFFYCWGSDRITQNNRINQFSLFCCLSFPSVTFFRWLRIIVSFRSISVFVPLFFQFVQHGRRQNTLSQQSFSKSTPTNTGVLDI